MKSYNHILTDIYSRIDRFIDYYSYNFPTLYGPVCIDKKSWTLSRLDNNFYSGLSGVALAVAAYAHFSKDGSVINKAMLLYHELVKVSREEVLANGLAGLSGWSGNLQAIFLIESILDVKTPFYIEYRKKIEDSILSFDSKGTVAVDFLDGLSGLAYVYWKLSQVADFDLCKEVYAVIAEQYQMQEVSGWFPSENFSKPVCGLSHGYSGIALGMAALGRLTENHDWFDTAFRMLSLEDQYFNHNKKNWPDLRCSNTSYYDFWCHGSPGIFFARATIAELTEKQPAYVNVAKDNAVKALVHSDNLTLCHGALGIFESLLGGSSFDLDSCYEKKWSGIPGGFESIGFMNGLSGILYGLLRVSQPSQYPSVIT